MNLIEKAKQLHTVLKDAHAQVEAQWKAKEAATSSDERVRLQAQLIPMVKRLTRVRQDLRYVVRQLVEEHLESLGLPVESVMLMGEDISKKYPEMNEIYPIPIPPEERYYGDFNRHLRGDFKEKHTQRTPGTEVNPKT